MPRTVLVAGASGLVGSQAVERFLAAGWDVVGVSRRRPEVGSTRFRHLPLDLRDRDETRARLAQETGITHVAYAALFEKPGLISGWLERDQMETNDRMLRNLLDALVETSPVEHVSVLQGTKAYGIHLHPIPIPARERLPRDEHENFYWLQEDYVRELGESRGLTRTILRPQVIFGGVYGVAMNILPVIGAFAAFCAEEGLSFGFPGGVSFVQEGVDARLMGDLLVWAATEGRAANETFNVTNGDVYEWRNLWPAIADTLGIEAGPDEPRSIADFMSERVEQWDRIVQRRSLRPIPLMELCGESHHYVDFLFAYGVEERPPYGLVSTVKLRQSGFDTFFDTEDTVCYWLNRLIRERVIPSANGGS